MALPAERSAVGSHLGLVSTPLVSPYARGIYLPSHAYKLNIDELEKLQEYSQLSPTIQLQRLRDTNKQIDQYTNLIKAMENKKIPPPALLDRDMVLKQLKSHLEATVKYKERLAQFDNLLAKSSAKIKELREGFSSTHSVYIINATFTNSGRRDVTVLGTGVLRCNGPAEKALVEVSFPSTDAALLIPANQSRQIKIVTQPKNKAEDRDQRDALDRNWNTGKSMLFFKTSHGAIQRSQEFPFVEKRNKEIVEELKRFANKS
jgi:hypothetical protein